MNASQAMIVKLFSSMRTRTGYIFMYNSKIHKAVWYENSFLYSIIKMYSIRSTYILYRGNNKINCVILIECSKMFCSILRLECFDANLVTNSDKDMCDSPIILTFKLSEKYKLGFQEAI